MSINWVMLHPHHGFVRLPAEELVLQSPPRTSLSITTPRSYPGNQPLSIQSSVGVVYLTNQRVLYLPAVPTKDLQSFSAPLLHLHDGHLVMPWLGANNWQAVLQPVPGGNIPISHTRIDLKLTFNEGGGPAFHETFIRIKERLVQAIEIAREGGVTPPVGGALGSAVNLEAVHLDQLPSYEASGQDAVAPLGQRDFLSSRRPPEPQGPAHEAEVEADRRPAGHEPPSEGPPGYEETQQQSVRDELERRF